MTAPTPTRIAEPIERSESTITLRWGRSGFSGKPYVGGLSSRRKKAFRPPSGPFESAP